MEQNSKLHAVSNRSHSNILLHVPHASTSFPNGANYSFKDLDDEERLLIDYYTDELFVPEKETDDIVSAVFPYCRLYADVERLVNDPLEKEGLGISYHRRVGELSRDVRSFSSLCSAFRLYADFHAMTSCKMVELGGKLLLIDCHSFSARPNLLNPTPPDIDICIGYNNDDTCPERDVIDCIVSYFKKCGYKVGINKPFSNSKTFPVPMEYHTIMIEVNKRLYMNEDTLEKTEGFNKLKKELSVLYLYV